MSFKHMKIQSLDDFFVPLSGRSEKGIYFYRFNKTSDKIDEFIYKYYNAARKSGVVIDGKIGNPTESNLSYYQEIMGMDFQMSMGFISDSLKKWLPRMRAIQRENIAGAIYDVLDGLRRSGKNENMLKNAYIKFMCWLYYKFEGVVEQMNGENIPKIFFVGDIVGYEFMLINILADAGCDVVFVQLHGDVSYLKVDENLERSFEYVGENGAAEQNMVREFAADFSIKSMLENHDFKAQRENGQGTVSSQAEIQRVKSHGTGGSQVDVQNIQRQESGIPQAEGKSTKSLQNKKSLNIKVQSTEADNINSMADRGGSQPKMSYKVSTRNCTNVWIEGNGLDDFLQPAGVRKDRFRKLYENERRTEKVNNVDNAQNLHIRNAEKVNNVENVQNLHNIRNIENNLGNGMFSADNAQGYGADKDKIFLNCYVRINGVWDKLTYENELYQFYLSLKAMKRNVVVISELIPKPDVDEIAKIRRGNYRDVFQLVKGLELNINFTENPIVSEFLINSFEDTVYGEADRLGTGANINKILNKAVYLLCFINRYQTQFFKNFSYDNIPCFIYMGGCNDENEAMFMHFLARTPIDVLILCPNRAERCRLEDNILYDINYDEQLAIDKFPIQNSGLHIGTAAYHAERELDTLMYNDDTIFRDKQYDKARTVSLQTMDREIKILWETEIKYRPGFSTVDGSVNIPVIFSKFSGVKDGNVREYMIMLKKLMTPETVVVDKVPNILSTDANPIKEYATEFFKNGRLHRDKIKKSRAYRYGFLRDEMQDYILDKLEFLIAQKYIKGTFENGTEYTIVSVALNLPKEVTRLLQAFDFTKKNPKLLYINTSDELISLEDTIYLTFLHLLGFDVALFVPTGYNMEKYFNLKLMEEHQLGDYIYDIKIPDWESIPLSLHTSWRDRLFRHG
ncbi:MAG: YceG family protein [Lachnospiraceae bacterium]|nr:MAG: YceG family protein [Lachnospiraceae bacterium]